MIRKMKGITKSHQLMEMVEMWGAWQMDQMQVLAWVGLFLLSEADSCFLCFEF